MRFPFDVVLRSPAGPVQVNSPVFVYEPDTTTEADLYDARTGGSLIPQPLVSDSEGRFPNHWIEENGEDGYDVYDPNDTINPTTRWYPPAAGSAIGGSAGGVLAGTYPDPEFAVDMATQAEISVIDANAQTDDYTLALSDAGKVIVVDSASAKVVTIPANGSLALAVGTVVSVMRYGAGEVSIAPGSGVTIRDPDGAGLAIENQYGTITLRKHATNEWVILATAAGAAEAGPAAAVAARVYNSVNQNVLNDTDTNVTFDSERWDSGGIHSTLSDTHRLTAPEDGLYVVTAHVQWAANATGYRRIALVHSVDGVIAQLNKQAQGDGTTPDRQSIATVYQLLQTEFVYVQVRQDSGATRVISAAAAYSPEFTLTKIAEAP